MNRAKTSAFWMVPILVMGLIGVSRTHFCRTVPGDRCQGRGHHYRNCGMEGRGP